MPTKRPTVSDVILAQLSLYGIRFMFGVPGDAVLPMLSAISQQKSIQFITTRHESSAAFMASAVGKCTDEIAVCLGTSGPGLVNMLNGIADAAADHIPTLVISGQVETNKVGTEAKQYVEQQQMMAPLAVYSAPLLHPEATVKVVQKAILSALSYKGVAHISIPQDVLTAPCPLQPRQPLGLLNTSELQNADQLDEAVQLLSAAQSPLIFIGVGARKASSSIIDLAETLGAGIIESLGAKGIVPYDHPLNLGGIGEGGSEESKATLQQSDCVLVVGANWWPEGYVPTNTNVIHVDVSPANIDAHPEVVCGLVGEAADVLSAIRQPIKQSARPAWRRQLTGTKEKIHAMLDQERTATVTPIAPQRLIAALDEFVDADAIIAVDTGDHTVWFNRVFRAKRQLPLFSGNWRTMGFGLPAAIAAQLTYPAKQVVALVGDGSLAMTMMELATAVKYSVPITVIVVNNGSLAMEKNSMLAQGMQPFGVSLANPDFSQLAKAFGATGIRVETADDLTPALDAAYHCGGPAVIDVLTSDDMPPLTYFEQAIK